MKSNRGQALVEFVIILPVIILIIMAIVDFGNIISNKYALENDLDTVVDLYKNNDNVDDYIKDRNENIEYQSSDKYITIKLSKDVNVTTPILNNVLGKKHQITVMRTISNDNK